MCCLSVKGGCYFATGLHIADSLFLLWTFIFDVVHVNKLYWNGAVQDDPNLTVYMTLVGIYICVSILLGSGIFQGIEREWGRMIGVCGVGFLVLQIVAFIITLCWWYPIPPFEDFFGLLESARIGRFVIRCLATIAYMAILTVHIRDLHLRETSVFRKPRDV